MVKHASFFFCTLLLATGLPRLRAQAGATITRNGGGFSGSATFGPPHLVMPPITGAPYSGEDVLERVQTLADGTHVTQKDTLRKVYRDSQGRTRSERPLGNSSR